VEREADAQLAIASGLSPGKNSHVRYSEGEREINMGDREINRMLNKKKQKWREADAQLAIALGLSPGKNSNVR
jgi:hypothetical protein